MANRLLQRGFLFPTDCLLSHILVKNVHDLSHLIIKFTTEQRSRAMYLQHYMLILQHVRASQVEGFSKSG